MPRSTRPKTKKSASASTPVVKQQKSALFLAAFLLFGLAFMTLFMCRAMGWHLFVNSRQQVQLAQASELSGIVHFTALKPDPEDRGEIVLLARRFESDDWQQLDAPTPLKQDSAWSWLDARPGVNYELQAVLVIDGEEVTRSEVIQTTAPAASIEIPLHVTWHDLPEDVVNVSTTKLAGEVTLNGYIPMGSVLEVYALDESHYTEAFHQITPAVLSQAVRIASVPNPQAMTTWMWEEAKPLDRYMVVAVLKQRGQIVGISDEYLSADAGEESLQHTINSEAVAPEGLQSSVPGLSNFMASLVAQSAGTRGISGTTTVVGPKQKDTSLLMLWRKAGDANFTPINRYMYPSHLGTQWQWPDAQTGQSYEITAALQVNEQNTSTPPNPVRVTAPASNVDFTLNTWYSIRRPDQKPANEVCIDGDGKSYTAVIRMPKITDGAQYWLQVGDKSGSSGTYNKMMPATDENQDLKVHVRVQKGKQYFMKYAYATCEHCSSSNNFSPYSDEVGFTCD